MLTYIVPPQGQGVDIGLDKARFGFEILADQGVGGVLIDAQQFGQRAHIDDVLEQLALARIGVGRVAHRGQRHADQGDVVANALRRQRLGRIVEQIAARLDGRPRPWPRSAGFIATIRSTPPRRPRWPASLTRTSYQVGRPWMLEGKMLRAATGTPMRRIDLPNNELALAEPEPLTLANLTTKSLMAPTSRRRTAVRGEVVHHIRHAPSACVMLSRNLRMSQAPVGQRSAQSPQCRQTSSSFTITRPVGSRLET